MTRCPDCGRRWDRDGRWCGACGARLDPAAGPAPGLTTGSVAASRRRAGILVGVVLVAALGIVLALTGDEAPGSGRGDTSDDTVALPTRPPPTAAPTAESGSEVQCTRARVPVDCLAWEVDTGHDISLGPRLPGSGLLVDSAFGGLTVRDADTGQVLWERDDLGGTARSVVDGVLVMAGDGTVRGLDATSGGELWERDGLQSIGQLARLDAGVVVLGRRPVDDGAVSMLVALDPRTGAERWTWSVPWEGAIESSVQPVGREGLVVTGAGRLARVDATTGRADWVVDTLDGAYLQPQLPEHVSAEQLGTDTDPQLWIHDVATGQVVHRMSAGRVVSHQVIDDVVVVHAPAEGLVRAMELGGDATRWRAVLASSGALAFPFAPADPGVVVLLERELQRVTRLSSATGEVLWQVELQAPPRPEGGGVFFGQPMLVDDVVVVEDTSSVITVLDVATGRERLRVAGGSQLDVRSLEPLTLVRGSRWMGIAVPPVDPPGQ